MRSVGIRSRRESLVVQRWVLGGVLEYSFSGEAPTLPSRRTGQVKSSRSQVKMDFLKSHIKLCLKTLYTKRHRENQGWSFADEDVKLLNKDAHFSVSVSMHFFSLANSNRLWVLVRDAAQDYIGRVYGILKNGTIVLFKIPTIELWKFSTSRPNGARRFHSMFQEQVGFFAGMLAEHRSWWSDEAESIVKIVAQMYRVLIRWNFKKQGCGWRKHKIFGNIWSFCPSTLAEPTVGLIRLISHLV